MTAYPLKSNPITINKASGVWAEFGTPQEIIPSNTITQQFTIVKVSIVDVSDTGIFQLKLFSGLPGNLKEFFSDSFSKSISFSSPPCLENGQEIFQPGERISGALTGDCASDANVKLYLGYETIGVNP